MSEQEAAFENSDFVVAEAYRSAPVGELSDDSPDQTAASNMPLGPDGHQLRTKWDYPHVEHLLVAQGFKVCPAKLISKAYKGANGKPVYLSSASHRVEGDRIVKEEGKWKQVLYITTETNWQRLQRNAVRANEIAMTGQHARSDAESIRRDEWANSLAPGNLRGQSRVFEEDSMAAAAAQKAMKKGVSVSLAGIPQPATG